MNDHEDEYARLDSETIHTGLAHVDSLLAGGIKKGELLLFTSGPNKGHSKVTQLMQRMITDASRQPPNLIRDFGELKVQFLKTRPENQHGGFYLDTEARTFTDEWSPAKQEQAEGRILRYPQAKNKVIINAIVILPKTSRRMREGVFVTFKKGRVIRKKHPAKIRQLELHAEVYRRLQAKIANLPYKTEINR